MNALRRGFKMAIMFTTHDLGVIANMADDIVIMYLGKMVKSAPVKDIFYHPYTQELMKSIPSDNLLLTVKHLKKYFPVGKNVLRKVITQVKAVDDSICLSKKEKRWAWSQRAAAAKPRPAESSFICWHQPPEKSSSGAKSLPSQQEAIGK
jgi:ABC-type dipeptide/oligopeptide/nickel transport system ATPase component